MVAFPAIYTVKDKKKTCLTEMHKTKQMLYTLKLLEIDLVSD